MGQSPRKEGKMGGLALFSPMLELNGFILKIEVLCIYFQDKSTVAIITLANWEWFQEWQDCQVKRRGDDYDEVDTTLKSQIMCALKIS